ncbi:AraC family transcriptional regulator [Gordoniibacillus kamchatkensis]|uniref:AraC family transcriptional regulator n=1 Tax=Gordoniibacillus kamchatkensis TaxID=1590651 RepID=A0ABR5AB17_9BACL|nr:AraC family transcriptional regulator [Paenibacillus sp. VKM B-2647]KIL38229.1 AraC family transcriptional regulator [Paenibacillus sp. VKM B-2647]
MNFPDDSPYRLDFAYRSDRPIEPVFHSHNFYEIYYFHEGVCNYLIGDRIYTLQPGDLILMNGMTLHCAKIDPSVPYVRSLLHFDPGALRPLLAWSQAVNVLQPFQELGNLRLSLGGTDRELVERLLAELSVLAKRTDAVGEGRFRLAVADLLHVVYELWIRRRAVQDRTELPTEKEQTVQRLITFLECHYTEDLHLEALQDHMHVSKFYLSKLFKEVTGVTIFEYLYRRRINQAKIEFVLDPAKTVTDVCFQVGFKHLAHFSRMFKRQQGVTPEQFKRRLASPSNLTAGD